MLKLNGLDNNFNYQKYFKHLALLPTTHRQELTSMDEKYDHRKLLPLS
jgi:hypothetical protein